MINTVLEDQEESQFFLPRGVMQSVPFCRLCLSFCLSVCHQFSLPDHTGRLMDCNFLIRSLFKDVY